VFVFALANGEQKAGPVSVFDTKEGGVSAGVGGTSDSLCVCYPFGATLKVNKPATPIVTSGALSFPSNRPLAAFNRVSCPLSLSPSFVSVFVSVLCQTHHTPGLIFCFGCRWARAAAY
jgi:hypothetical protein